MKRLKKAEYFDGIPDNWDKDNIIDIYKNPTSSEFDDIIKHSKWHTARMFEKEDGTIYAWDGALLEHRSMASKKPSIVGPVHLQVLLDDNQFVIYIEPAIKDAKTLVSYLNKLNFNNYKVPMSMPTYIIPGYYGAPDDPIYKQIATLQDLFNKVKELDVAASKKM